MNEADAIDARVLAHLERAGVPYEVVQIDPAFADTASFCAHYGFAMEKSVNTIIVASKKEPKVYAACAVTATTRLDVNHKVKELMGVQRLSFADADETVALTGMKVGGVTVFALPPGMPIYVDERVMACDRVILGGGGRSTKVHILPEVFNRIQGVRVVSGLATPRTQ